MGVFGRRVHTERSFIGASNESVDAPVLTLCVHTTSAERTSCRSILPNQPSVKLWL